MSLGTASTGNSVGFDKNSMLGEDYWNNTRKEVGIRPRRPWVGGYRLCSILLTKLSNLFLAKESFVQMIWVWGKIWLKAHQSFKQNHLYLFCQIFCLHTQHVVLIALPLLIFSPLWMFPFSAEQVLLICQCASSLSTPTVCFRLISVSVYTELHGNAWMWWLMHWLDCEPLVCRKDSKK